MKENNVKKNNKRIIFTIGGLLTYILIIFIVCYFLTVPNVKRYNEAKSILPLTQEERKNLINDINGKYGSLETEINDKYKQTIEEINTKYNAEENNLKAALAEKKAQQTDEFYANGFSEKYYTLENEISSLNGKLSSLEFDKSEELFNLDGQKQEEIDELKIEKNAEINKIDNQEIERNNEIRNSILYIIVSVIIMLIPLIYLVIIFNNLIRLRNKVKASWSKVDVYLKQRADLIPNIVETVKGYSKQESNTLEDITKARSNVMNANTKEDEITANQELSKIIPKIFALSEAYPDLKANTNFMDLSNNLSEIEDNIAYARNAYNNAVLNYKNKLEVFPSNLIATILNFEPELFFEISEEESENPTINFNN